MHIVFDIENEFLLILPLLTGLFKLISVDWSLYYYCERKTAETQGLLCEILRTMNLSILNSE